MLKKIKQISLFLACMILLLHAIVPHHHHPDKPICINGLNHNKCNNHNSCCDFQSHKDHNHDESHCIIDDYFAPKDNNEIIFSLDSEDLLSHYNIIFNSLTTDLILKEEGKEIRRAERTFIYRDPLAISNIGLRAPPTC